MSLGQSYSDPQLSYESDQARRIEELELQVQAAYQALGPLEWRGHEVEIPLCVAITGMKERITELEVAVRGHLAWYDTLPEPASCEDVDTQMDTLRAVVEGGKDGK
jgi:hypothetical protein